MRRSTLTLLFALIAPTSVAAQDAHYWTLQSGARATLLGGLVVAMEPDLSASYYNPGALARGNDADALSMFAKTTSRMRITLGSSPTLTAKSDIGAAAPGFFAVRIPGAHIVEGDVVTFSYLVRQSSRLDLGGAAVASPAVPTAAADLFVFQDIYDGWYGLSWARDVETVGIGVSVFYSSVSHRQRIEAREVSLPGPGAGLIRSDDLDFTLSVRRLIVKGGATWTGGPLTLGATVTLPSLRLPLSGGKVSVGHVLLSRDGTQAAELVQDSQEDVSAQLKQPLSVALGAETTLAGFDLYASAEWFASLDRYDVMKTAPFTSQLPAEQTDLPIVQSRESVLNMGAGLSWQAASYLSFFGSVRTDKSFRDSTRPSFVGLDHFDLHHLTAGIGIFTQSLDLWIGALYGAGDAREQLAPSPLPESLVRNATTTFEHVGFVLAFSASF